MWNVGNLAAAGGRARAAVSQPSLSGRRAGGCAGGRFGPASPTGRGGGMGCRFLNGGEGRPLWGPRGGGISPRAPGSANTGVALALSCPALPGPANTRLGWGEQGRRGAGSSGLPGWQASPCGLDDPEQLQEWGCKVEDRLPRSQMRGAWSQMFCLFSMTLFLWATPSNAQG